MFRPDSGDPVKIIRGDPDAPQGSPAHKGAIECLWEVFGGTMTEKGFRVLDAHVGLIYSDSITLDRAERILEGLKAKGFPSGNVMFGIGSFTYQYVTRDTFEFAVKSTYSEVNGVGRVIFKDPVTDRQRIPTVGLQFSVHEMTDKARDASVPFKAKPSQAEIAEEGKRWHREVGRMPFFNYSSQAGNSSAEDADRVLAHFDPCRVGRHSQFGVRAGRRKKARNAYQRELAGMFSFRRAWVQHAYVRSGRPGHERQWIRTALVCSSVDAG